MNVSSEGEDNNRERKVMVVLSYVHGVSEKISRALRKHGVVCAFKPHVTLRRKLVHPKDKTKPSEKCGVVYDIPCSNCEANYIGQSGRRLQTRIDEHSAAVGKGSTSSAVAIHTLQTGHLINWGEVKIRDSDSDDNRRLVREAIQIRKRGPSMNRNKGYTLPHIYDQLISGASAVDGSVQELSTV